VKGKLFLVPLLVTGTLVGLTYGCSAVGRKLMFYPTHEGGSNGLSPWLDQGQPIGLARTAAAPQVIWLFIHGNGGEASDRTYALPCFSPEDTIYILEYPGYGHRKGTTSRRSW
jgi:uncharacterized protein